MRMVSEKEVERLISEFAYDGETSGVLGCFCEEGFPVYCANKTMISMLGYESVEDLMTGISGKGFNVVHPDDRSQVMNDIGNHIREGSFFQSIYRMRRKDGSWFWTIDKGKAVKMEDGRLLLLSLFSDMTEFAKFMKEREESEERKNKKLEKEKNSAVSANEMKSRFLSSISHDIRTPINGIQGMLRIADAYPNDMKKQNECREKMWIATNYLVSLVNNVLNMNRLENRSIDLTKQPFNLINLLMDITSMADLQTNAEGLHSVVDWKGCPEF